MEEEEEEEEEEIVEGNGENEVDGKGRRAGSGREGRGVAIRLSSLRDSRQQKQTFWQRSPSRQGTRW